MVEFLGSQRGYLLEIHSVAERKGDAKRGGELLQVWPPARLLIFAVLPSLQFILSEGWCHHEEAYTSGINAASEPFSMSFTDAATQSEIYRGIFDDYGGTSGKIFDNYRGNYVGEVQI